MRIALVRARYNPSGGAERFAERAMLALAEQDTSVSIIARSWTGSEHAGARCQVLLCDPFYLGSIWRDWSFAQAVTRLVRRHPFDLVQSHERIPGLAIYRAGDGVHAAWLARRCRALPRWRRLAVWMNPHHWYLVRIERALFEHPDLRAVICNSSLVAREILERFRIDPAKLRQIPNGVDLERFCPSLALAHRQGVREALGIGGTQPTLIFIGSGFERKGLCDALEAIAGLPAPVHLLVLGRDKHADRYRALAHRFGLQDRVHFKGEVEDPLPYLGAADAMVLPTLYDPFPNAVLEGLACGLPVVTSDGCGAVDVIRAGQNGWIHRASDVVDLRSKLVSWLDRRADPGGPALLAQAARASVLGYGTDILARELIRLYEELLARPA